MEINRLTRSRKRRKKSEDKRVGIGEGWRTTRRRSPSIRVIKLPSAINNHRTPSASQTAQESQTHPAVHLLQKANIDPKSKQQRSNCARMSEPNSDNFVSANVLAMQEHRFMNRFAHTDFAGMHQSGYSCTRCEPKQAQ